MTGKIWRVRKSSGLVPEAVDPAEGHACGHESGKPAKMLISVAPAGLEEMFFEVGQPVAVGATAAPLPTKADIEKLLKVAPLYGIDIKLPGH